MSRPELHCVCGPVAAGKSSYAANAARDGAVVVNNDAVVTMIHGGNYMGYSKSLSPLYDLAQYVIASTALSLGKTVVIDRGNRNKESRRKWVDLARVHGVKINAILFANEGAEVHARRRFNSDSRGYSYQKWLEVAERHELETESITPDEGFYHVIFAHWPKVSQGWWSNPNGGSSELEAVPLSVH